MEDLQLESNLVRLRDTLKAWELSFAKLHGGCKPSRLDVKGHPEIAQRYREYNKARAALGPPPSRTRSRKSLVKEETRTGRVAGSLHASPTKITGNPSGAPVDEVFDQVKQPTPSVLSPSGQRAWIGPTPQKDGIVLGIFDSPPTVGILIAKEFPHHHRTQPSVSLSDYGTPSKSSRQVAATTNQGAQERPDLLGTTKHKDVIITTPNSRKRVQCEDDSPTSKRHARVCEDETPTFLRRTTGRLWSGERETINYASPSKTPNIVNNTPDWTPMRPRPTLRNAGRGLSAILRSLRKVHDDGLDEDLDALREAEGLEASPPTCFTLKAISKDSSCPLGPDGHQLANDHDGFEGGENEQPAQVWKKRGQKRTTKRANLRPNNIKWVPEAEWTVSCGDTVDDEGTPVPWDQENDSNQHSSNLTEDKIERKVELADGAKATENVPLKGRKTKATAHANYRTLKIRNRSSKPKQTGRFRRR